MQVGFWGLYIFPYPLCVDTWNQFQENELRISEAKLLRSQIDWPPLLELQRKQIESTVGEKNIRGQIPTARKMYFANKKRFCFVSSIIEGVFKNWPAY